MTTRRTSHQGPKKAPASAVLPLSHIIDMAIGVDVGSVNFNLMRHIFHVIVSQLGMENLNIEFRGSEATKLKKMYNPHKKQAGTSYTPTKEDAKHAKKEKKEKKRKSSEKRKSDDDEKKSKGEQKTASQMNLNDMQLSEERAESTSHINVSTDSSSLSFATVLVLGDKDRLAASTSFGPMGVANRQQIETIRKDVDFLKMALSHYFLINSDDMSQVALTELDTTTEEEEGEESAATKSEEDDSPLQPKKDKKKKIKPMGPLGAVTPALPLVPPIFDKIEENAQNIQRLAFLIEDLMKGIPGVSKEKLDELQTFKPAKKEKIKIPAKEALGDMNIQDGYIGKSSKKKLEAKRIKHQDDDDEILEEARKAKFTDKDSTGDTYSSDKTGTPTSREETTLGSVTGETSTKGSVADFPHLKTAKILKLEHKVKKLEARLMILEERSYTKILQKSMSHHKMESDPFYEELHFIPPTKATDEDMEKIGMDFKGSRFGKVILANMPQHEAMHCVQDELNLIRNNMIESYKAMLEKVDAHEKLLTNDQSTNDEISASVRMTLIERRFMELFDQVKSLDTCLSSQMDTLSQQVSDIERELGNIVEKLYYTKENNQTESNIMELFNKVLVVEDSLNTLADSMSTFLQEHDKRQKFFHELKTDVEILKIDKVNKADFEDALDEKVDICFINRKVSHEQFETTCDVINKGVEEALLKLTNQEGLWQEALNDIKEQISTKLDAKGLDPLHEFISAKLKRLQDKIKLLNKTKSEREAAGTKLKYLEGNCISCDKDVVMRRKFDPLAHLNVPKLPPPRNIGPYLAYELDQLRRQQKTLPTQRNLHDFEYALKQKKAKDSLVVNRYCGGTHTITTPQQRVSRVGHFLDQWGDNADLPTEAKPVRGTDGQIYKGALPTPRDTPPEVPSSTRPKAINLKNIAEKPSEIIKPSFSEIEIPIYNVGNYPEGTDVRKTFSQDSLTQKGSAAKSSASKLVNKETSTSQSSSQKGPNYTINKKLSDTETELNIKDELVPMRIAVANRGGILKQQEEPQEE